MEKRKILILLLATVFCTGMLLAGGQQEKGSDIVVSKKDSADKMSQNSTISDWLVENTDDHITIIDNGGYHITIKKPIERVLASGMAVFPTIRALQAENVVIGTQGIDEKDGEILFPYMSKLPVIAPEDPSAFLDYEKVVQMNPDLFIVLATFREQVAESLSPAGIPVIQLDFGSNKDILILGTLLGKEKEAEEYVSWIENETSTIEDQIKNLPEDEVPSVFLYYGGSYGIAPPPPYGSYGRDNFLGNKMIEMAGGRSLTAENRGEWINVDSEWIIEQNPDVLIREYYNITKTNDPELGYSASSNLKAKIMMDTIVAMPAFESSNAVREKNVHMIFGNIVSESWFLGLPYIAKWLHPEIFKDLDPHSIYQEFITRFMRVDYNIYEQGIYSYSVE